MNDCLFCKLAKENTNKIYEDNLFYVIKDIEPKAPLHYLAIYKRHIKTFDEMDENDVKNLGQIFQTIAKISVEVLGLKGGYRVVINQGDNAGQTVPHLHIHLLGGREMGWTPA